MLSPKHRAQLDLCFGDGGGKRWGREHPGGLLGGDGHEALRAYRGNQGQADLDRLWLFYPLLLY